VLAFATPFLLPDKPATASFLTPEEREFVITRLEFETGSGSGKVTNDDRITFAHVKHALSEWKIWAMVIVFYGNSIGVYGFTYTVPSVILGLGYTAANAQLLTIPVYVFAMIVTLAVAFYSDKVKQRSPFIIMGFIGAACGFLALLVIPHPLLPGLTYGFLFLAAAGLYCPLVCIVSWIGSSSPPPSPLLP
jgi:MFS family permease